jgi:hypothetical protein
MADEDVKQTPPAPKQEDKSETAEQDKAWAEITKGKFKDPTEVAKAYISLEEKLGEQGQEISRAREVMDVMYPIMQEIQNDPELFKALEKKLNKVSSESKPTEDNKPAISAKSDQSEVRSVASDLVLAKFEETHGIDRLEPEERRELRRKIGDAIYELTGTNLGGVDLRRLGKTLENAYILTKYKSKSAVSSETEDEDRASFSSLPSKSGKTETVLTPDEASVAEKMGLTREQYLEGKKKLAK